MSLVMQRFRKCLEENHIEYYEDNPDSDVIADKGLKGEKIQDPMWDVSGYEGRDTVSISLRSYISPELAAKIIKIYEDYFTNKED